MNGGLRCAPPALRIASRILRFGFRGWASIQTEMKNWQLPLLLSRRKPGSMLLLSRTFRAIAAPYQRLPARAVGTMDPGISPGKMRGSVAE
jgi:hypothetical protein